MSPETLLEEQSKHIYHDYHDHHHRPPSGVGETHDRTGTCWDKCVRCEKKEMINRATIDTYSRLHRQSQPGPSVPSPIPYSFIPTSLPPLPFLLIQPHTAPPHPHACRFCLSTHSPHRGAGRPGRKEKTAGAPRSRRQWKEILPSSWAELIYVAAAAGCAFQAVSFVLQKKGGGVVMFPCLGGMIFRFLGGGFLAPPAALVPSSSSFSSQLSYVRTSLGIFWTTHVLNRCNKNIF